MMTLLLYWHMHHLLERSGITTVALLLTAWAIFVPASAIAESVDTVAVLDFKANNASASDAVTITGFVRSAFVRAGVYRVVDKENMEKILAEQAFQQTGCTDQNCAVKLGKLLNVKKMIVGEYAVVGEMRFLTGSFVDVETGRIERAGKVKGFAPGNIDDAAEDLARQLVDGAPSVGAKASVPHDGGEMVLIPEGDFNMGTKGYFSKEPIHVVHLDAYLIDKYEVTFSQYDAFCDATSRTKPDDGGWGRGSQPINSLSWSDSKAYCEWAGKRLPTEAEWERACRAGTDTAYSFGDNAKLLGNYAWYKANSGSMTHPVGEKLPNAFGLYDMHGNVWEWVADWYDSGYYKVSPLNNPQGPTSGKEHIMRGGSCGGKYLAADVYLRSAFRYNNIPAYRGGVTGGVGCRCAKTP